MKRRLLLIATGWLAGAAWATRPPGHDSTETAAAKATDVSVGVLLSAIRTNETANHVLITSIRVERSLFGTMTNGMVVAKYREFMIRAIPEGMSVCFANYTGSGIEWDARTNASYICFFQQQTNEVVLLRLEPLSNESRVSQALDKSRKRTPQQRRP